MQRSPPEQDSDPRRGLGERGERLARLHLEARGLRVIDANFRTRHGELDIVAVDPRCLVFCEVKTRMRAGPAAGEEDAGELGPFAAIGRHKRQRVRLIAREWLAQRGLEAPWRPELRFDAIGVELDPEGRLTKIDHLEGAF